jgi:glycine oxidase
MEAYIGTVSDVIYDTVIVGAGVIGLASAFALAQEGYRVALVDDAPGAGASYAAAGMLAPGAESSPEHASFTQQTVRAREQWPTFLADINRVAEANCELQIPGSVFVGWDVDDRREWRRYFETAHEQGLTSRTISRDDELPRFSGLSERVSDGYFVSSDAYVDPDEIVSGLISAAQRRGVEIHRSRATHCHVKDGEAMTEIAGSTVVSRTGIVATGFQREPLEILSSSVRRLRPVRGVTLRLRSVRRDEQPMVRAYVKGRLVYVVRRRDGTVLVGASSDESPERVVEAGSVRRLLEDATLVVPELDEAQFLEARVGLRPASDQQIPFFERLADGPWAWSGGHYRHGFLMAPQAAQTAVDFVRQLLP